MVARKSIQKPFRKKRTTRPLKQARMVPTKALTNAVKSIQFSNQETKLKQVNIIENQGIQGNGLDYDFATNSYLGGGGLANVLAQAALLDSGSTEFQRIGNEISPVSLTLKGFVRCMPYDDITNSNRTPFDLYMVIYKKRDEPEGVTDKLSSYNDGTKGKINGSIVTTVLNPFNRDNYVIKKLIKFPMKAQPLINANAITNPATNPTIENPETGGLSTRDYFKTFNVKVPVKKVLKYNSQNQGAPVNDWFGIGFYYINGDATATTASPAAQIRAQVTVQSTLRYKDA